MKAELILLTQAKLDELRKKQYKKQNGKCAITGLPYDYKDCVFDHKHKRKTDPLGGPEGLGLLRGVIGKNVNTFEGRIYKNFKRYGLSEDIELPDLLRRIADYLENPPMPQIYVHPKERPKRIKLSKLDYWVICRFWFLEHPRKRTLPKYPKDGIQTERWNDMIFKAYEWRKLYRQKKLDKQQIELVEKGKALLNEQQEKKRKAKKRKADGIKRENI
jgi:hypothetical protein